MKKRLLSFFLILVLLVGVVPIHVRADGGSPKGDYGSFVSGEQVISDMIAHSGQNAHPRLIMTNEKFAELKKYVTKDGSGKITIDTSTSTGILLSHLKLAADQYAEKIEKGEYRQYDASSEDHLLEASKEVQRRVTTLALAYNIFDEDRYAECAYKELKNVCDKYKDWSPGHFLDTAEMCTAFALAYDWLYDWLGEDTTEDRRAVLREKMINNGLKQVMNDYEFKVHYVPNPTKYDERTYCWYKDGIDKGDNWQLVCTGGTDLVALAIGDEEDAKEISAKVLNFGYKRAYEFVRRAYDTTDGTYIEGLGYWDYATYYLGLHSSALMTATGTDYGLADHEGVEKSAEFVHYMSSNYPYSFSFGDDRDCRDTGWAVFLWLGEYLDSPGLSAIRLNNIKTRYKFNYLDVLWIDESKQNGNQLSMDTDWGVVGGSNASFRTSWDSDGLVAALHSGKNDYFYHGNFDLGSFYIEYNGTRFFTDLGNETFYKLPNREYSYRIITEGHNTLTINPPAGKYYGQSDKISCEITEYREGNEAYAVTDLTKAYEEYDAKKVIRGLKMIKDKECIIIQDEISLNNPGEIYWFAHTYSDATISIASDKKSAVIKRGSNKLWVGLLSDGELTKMDAKPLPTTDDISGALKNDDYKKLAIHLTGVKDTTISVVCIPLKGSDTEPSWIPSVEEISAWSGEGAVHTHIGTKVNKVNATCTEAGVKEYYKCSCGEIFEDAACTKAITDMATLKDGEPLGHDFTGSYDGYDEINHWKICKRDGCEATDQVAAHYGGTATVTGKAICAGCGQSYGETLKVPKVTAPVVSETIIYDPSKTLANYTLVGTSATFDGKPVTGSWSWKNATEVPVVSKKKYTAVFTPSDSAKYAPAEAEVTLTVKQAEAIITTVPTASEITYGQSISNSKLTGGEASVEGSFAWAADDVVKKPTVADSDSKTYTVEFRPTDSVNYKVVTTEVKVKVKKAENAPNKPVTSMNTAFDNDKVSKITLPDDWKWEDGSANLTVGVPYAAKAIYDGADAGNYVNETVSVTITRSSCNHDADSEVRDAKEASCSEEGYTGDTYCTKCGECIQTGQSIATTEHTGGTATCTKLKKCTKCGTSYGEVNPANHAEHEVRGKKNATCTEDGYSGDTYCKACNTLIKQGSATPKATGHKYERTVTVEPTYDEEGVATYTCSVCKDEYTEKIDKRPLDIPSIKGKDTVRGWDDIKSYINEDDQSESLEINMNGNYVVPVDLLEVLAGHDIEITFTATYESKDISWTVKGSEINAEDIVAVDIRNLSKEGEDGSTGEGEDGSTGEGAAPEKPPVKPAPKPVEPEPTPTEPEVTPAKPEQTPTKPEQTPAKPEQAPAKTEQTPAKTEQTPAKQDQISTNKQEQVTVESKDPKKSQADEANTQLAQDDVIKKIKETDDKQVSKQEDKKDVDEAIKNTKDTSEVEKAENAVGGFGGEQIASKDEPAKTANIQDSVVDKVEEKENSGYLKFLIGGIVAAASVAGAAVVGGGIFFFRRRR